MQQVNLYTLEFRRHEQPLSSRTVLWALAACLVLIVIIQSLNVWRLSTARDELTGLQQQEQQLAARLSALKAAQPTNTHSVLEREVAALRSDIQRREELQSLISQQNLGNTRGFSPFMEGLARQAHSDLSLTEIRLQQGGRYLELAGWTRRAEVVPFYLQQLRNERAFEGVRFGVLAIQGPEAEQPYLPFSLRRSEDAL